MSVTVTEHLSKFKLRVCFAHDFRRVRSWFLAPDTWTEHHGSRCMWLKRFLNLMLHKKQSREMGLETSSLWRYPSCHPLPPARSCLLKFLPLSIITSLSGEPNHWTCESVGEISYSNHTLTLVYGTLKSTVYFNWQSKFIPPSASNHQCPIYYLQWAYFLFRSSAPFVPNKPSTLQFSPCLFTCDGSSNP